VIRRERTRVPSAAFVKRRDSSRNNRTLVHATAAPVCARDTQENAKVALSPLTIAEAEQALIESALVEKNNNCMQALELLGVSVRTLCNKLNKPD
jgi:DNA-binding NtrC family response regulator